MVTISPAWAVESMLLALTVTCMMSDLALLVLFGTMLSRDVNIDPQPVIKEVNVSVHVKESQMEITSPVMDAMCMPAAAMVTCMMNVLALRIWFGMIMPDVVCMNLPHAKKKVQKKSMKVSL